MFTQDPLRAPAISSSHTLSLKALPFPPEPKQGWRIGGGIFSSRSQGLAAQRVVQELVRNEESQAQFQMCRMRVGILIWSSIKEVLSRVSPLALSPNLENWDLPLRGFYAASCKGSANSLLLPLSNPCGIGQWTPKHCTWYLVRNRPLINICLKSYYAKAYLLSRKNFLEKGEGKLDKVLGLESSQPQVRKSVPGVWIVIR